MVFKASGPDQTIENTYNSLHENVHSKHESDSIVKDKCTLEELNLHKYHEIKDEMIIWPVVLQIPDVVQASASTCDR